MLDSFYAFMPFSFVSFALILGVFLRRYVPFVQKFLVPASIAGGVVGFIIINSFETGLNSNMFTMITFQFFNLSFISLGLTNVDKEVNTSKVVTRGILWMAIMNTMLLCGQALVGVSVWETVNFLLGTETYNGYGFLLAHGFVQGPGQALAVGGVWENKFGIIDSTNIALTFSAIGFIVASFVGVPLALWGIRKGAAHYQTEDMCTNYLKGVKKIDDNESCGRETLYSGNIDTFSFHLALIAITYALNFGLCKILSYIFAGTVLGDMIFGLFFMWGMFTAMAVRKFVSIIGWDHLVDSNVQRHFTGIFVDFLVTGTLLSINIAVVLKYAFQLTAVCIAATIFTVFLVVYLGRRLNEYGLERLLLIFGAGTGTIPSGLALLRIVDQKFKTSVAFESGAQQIILTFTMNAVVIVVSAFPASNMSIWELLGLDLLVFVGGLILLKILKLWGPKKF